MELQRVEVCSSSLRFFFDNDVVAVAYFLGNGMIWIDVIGDKFNISETRLGQRISEYVREYLRGVVV